MNAPKYAKIYSEFHGSSSFTTHGGDYIILGFKDEPWETFLVSRLYQSDRIESKPKMPFVQALKILFKTEAPTSTFCKQDSFSILLGKERIIFPVSDLAIATIRLCATPFFVRNPDIVNDYLQGVARPSTNQIFTYNNSVLYLDSYDIPYPGGCYFNSSSKICKDSAPLYRICILSQEPIEQIIKIANSWKVRRGISCIPFETRDAISRPKLIRFKPVQQIDFDSNSSLVSNTIQKRLSIRNPLYILQDILNSYYRHVLRLYEDSEVDSNPRMHLQSLGLVVEWPLRISYEGLHRTRSKDKTFVALAVNGHRPNRVLAVNRPYERYTEYQDVPATIWIPISYVPTILETPMDVVKVSVESTVIGFVVQNTFFCLSHPMLEGRPTHASQSNIHYIFNMAKPNVLKDNRIKIIETFRHDEKYILYHISFQGIEKDAWCFCEDMKNVTVYPKHVQLPWLVYEWINLFESNKNNEDNYINIDIAQLALVLTRHGICFQTKIEDPQRKRKESNKMNVDETTIELCMSQEVSDYVTSAQIKNKRKEQENDDENEEFSCKLM